MFRQVHLPPTDWARVGWRPRPAAAAPRPFDLESFLETALSGAWRMHAGSEHPTAPSLIPALLTREEAWLWQICLETRATQPEYLEKRLRVAYGTPLPGDKEVRALTAHLARRHDCLLYVHPQLLRPFFTPLEIALLTVRRAQRDPAQTGPWQMLGFASQVAVHLDEEERSSLRIGLEQAYDKEPDPGSPTARLLLALLSTVGGGSRLRRHLEALPVLSWVNPPPNPLCRHWRSGHLDMLAGLASEAEFSRQAVVLGCTPRGPSDLRLWLAATEWRQLGVALKAVLGTTSRAEAQALAQVLALVEAPETAVAMLQIQLHSRVPEVAQQWFATHPLHTLAGLAPVTRHKGPLAQAALAQLQRLPDPEIAPLKRQLSREDPDWMERVRTDIAFSFRGAPSLVSNWRVLTALPPIIVRGDRLNAGQTLTLLDTLTSLSGPGGPQHCAPLLAALRAQADPASLEDFAWRLFQQWEDRSFPGQHAWVADVLSSLGGETCAWRLSHLLLCRNLGYGDLPLLRCLHALGSPIALATLALIRESTEDLHLAQEALSLLNHAAHARELPPDVLTDSLLADVGLSRWVFDLGARQLTPVLDADLTLLLRDAAGRLHGWLPGPVEGDKRQLRERAAENWGLLQETLAEICRQQREALEAAMHKGRRWRCSHLQRALQPHSLTQRLLAPLVLGVYDGDRLLQTFRVTEEATFADCKDEDLTLPGDAAIGVAHPSHLDEATRAAWGEILSDYRIIQPFAQLTGQLLQ